MSDTRRSEGSAARAGASAAPGTGSPVHPPVAHLTFGTYLTGAVLDLASVSHAFAASTSHDLFRAGTFVFIVGNVAIVLALIAGFADRKQRTAAGSEDRAAVNKHALGGFVVWVLSVADTVVRQGASSSTTHTPVPVFVLTVLVAVGLLATGRMGGKLVFLRGIGPAGRSAR
ncbi:DUF2231 domain-containing protein [Streptomyces sp. NPDC052301]|uniref:DUF2231 domain-containing protein n=1 Tax=Streptomyces sp. NPDC052301 TaxID=3365687 RepID=UPI0037D98EEF